MVDTTARPLRAGVTLALCLLAALAAGAAAGRAHAAAPAGPPAPSDSYLAGYATAVLERELGVRGARLEVIHGVISLRAADLTGVDRERAVSALSALPGVVAVRVVEEPSPPAGPAPPAPESTAQAEPAAAPPEALATGFLKAGRLFDPLIADPRWPHFGASYQRYLGDSELRNVGAVSLGESFSLYRGNVPLGGQWEVGLQAGVFSIFDLDGQSSDLVNADYFVALTGSYRLGDWQALARFFHQSSHLGDEFLLQNRVERVNLSYEGLGLLLSRSVLDEAVRLYGGGSVLVRRDPASLDPWAVQYGVELYSPWRLARGIRPVAAVDLQNRQQNDWATDVSVRAGLQFEGVQVLGRKLQIVVEYFDGHSPNGQFYVDRINYIGIGAHLY
jgi:hypothetical protein